MSQYTRRYWVAYPDGEIIEPSHTTDAEHIITARDWLQRNGHAVPTDDEAVCSAMFNLRFARFSEVESGGVIIRVEIDNGGQWVHPHQQDNLRAYFRRESRPQFVINGKPY